MKEIIDSFGMNNFIIIVVVVVAILLALLIIFIVEKINKKRSQDIFEYYIEDNDLDDVVEDEVTHEEKKEDVLVEIPKVNEVVYQEEVISEAVAKKTLEEVTKKLVNEEKSDLVGPTHFEVEQEERSVISYEELKKINYDIDEVNDNLLVDEGDLPITIDELYKKHADEQQNVVEEQVEIPVPKEKPQVELFDNNGQKKFKNSEVISPVFGIYHGEVKQQKIGSKENSLQAVVNSHDLETEIQKTEEFLKELKKLKDKLD